MPHHRVLENYSRHEIPDFDDRQSNLLPSPYFYSDQPHTYHTNEFNNENLGFSTLPPLQTYPSGMMAYMPGQHSIPPNHQLSTPNHQQDLHHDSIHAHLPHDFHIRHYDESVDNYDIHGYDIHGYHTTESYSGFHNSTTLPYEIQGSCGTSSYEGDELSGSAPRKSSTRSSQIRVSTRRAEQNRTAQRAFRERRNQYLKELEEKASESDRLVGRIEETQNRVLELTQAVGRLEHDRESWNVEREAWWNEREQAIKVVESLAKQIQEATKRSDTCQPSRIPPPDDFHLSFKKVEADNIRSSQ